MNIGWLSNIDWTGIIEKSSQSPLSIVALVTIVLAILIWALFKESKSNWAKVLALLIFLGVVVLLYYMISGNNGNNGKDEIITEEERGQIVLIDTCKKAAKIIEDYCSTEDWIVARDSSVGRCELSIEVPYGGWFFADAVAKFSDIERYKHLALNIESNQTIIIGQLVSTSFSINMVCYDHEKEKACRPFARIFLPAYPEICVNVAKELRQ